MQMPFDFVQADKYFAKAIETPRYKTPERALENAGACAKRIPDLEKAENYLRKALSINPKLPLALSEMALRLPKVITLAARVRISTA